MRVAFNWWVVILSLLGLISIKSFDTLSLSMHGTEAQYYEYRVVSEEDGMTIYLYKHSYMENDVDATIISKEHYDNDKKQWFIDKLNEYSVLSWDGFNKNNKYVLDGSGFNFSLTYNDGEELYARGYMKFPQNFHALYGLLIALAGEE